MSRKNIRKKPIKSLNIRKNKGGIHMSGHSKWHNMNNSFLTATRLSKNKSMFQAQFWHNSINKEQHKTTKNNK